MLANQLFEVLDGPADDPGEVRGGFVAARHGIYSFEGRIKMKHAGARFKFPPQLPGRSHGFHSGFCRDGRDGAIGRTRSRTATQPRATTGAARGNNPHRSSAKAAGDAAGRAVQRPDADEEEHMVE